MPCNALSVVQSCGGCGSWRLGSVTSAWGDLTVGKPVRSSMDLPCEPFSLRLVSLPASLSENAQRNDGQQLWLTRLRFVHPGRRAAAPVSSFSPERNVVDSLRLIRADGSLQETLACFQMLAQLMKLPFRRESRKSCRTISAAVLPPISSSVVSWRQASACDGVTGAVIPGAGANAALAWGIRAGDCQ